MADLHAYFGERIEPRVKEIIRLCAVIDEKLSLFPAQHITTDVFDDLDQLSLAIRYLEDWQALLKSIERERQPGELDFLPWFSAHVWQLRRAVDWFNKPERFNLKPSFKTADDIALTLGEIKRCAEVLKTLSEGFLVRLS